MIHDFRTEEFKLVDHLCDEFESAIKNKDAVTLSSFLEQVPVAARDSLLAELVAVQRYYDLGSSTDADPETIGKYQVQEKIGVGSFGVVYRAVDEEVGRDVAIKIPRLDRPVPFDRVSIAREARRLARLSHSGLAKFHYCATHPELNFFMVSEHVAGCLLRDKIQHNPPDWNESVAIVSQLCDVLSYLHEHNTYHCDLKPSNIILTEEGPVVIDFGLATTEESFQIHGDAVFGTPGYISPEQMQGRSSASGDVFSLGVIFYEMLTGSLPYSRSLKPISENESPKSPGELNSKIPGPVNNVCRKAISLDETTRFRTAGDFKKQLETCQNAWGTRRKFLVAGTALGGVLFGGLAVGSTKWGDSTVAPTKPSESPSKRLVKIRLQPENSRAVFWPLSGEQLFQDGSNTDFDPANDAVLELSPGPYLVVVYQDDDSFIEAFRYVPHPDEAMVGFFPHRRWKIDEEGFVNLIRIKIPETVFASKLVRCEAKGISLYCDDCETTLAEYKQIVGQTPRYMDKNFFPASENQPATFVTFDQAIAFAERIGKRLMEEHEYNALLQFNGGKFPWGDEWPKTATDWVVGPVKSHEWDQVTIGEGAVFGLYSNAAEWTVGWNDEDVPEPTLGRPNRIVRGASSTVLNGSPFADDYQRRADFRFVENGVDYHSKTLGFRCVKSIRPRILSSDFQREHATE